MVGKLVLNFFYFFIFYFFFHLRSSPLFGPLFSSLLFSSSSFDVAKLALLLSSPLCFVRVYLIGILFLSCFLGSVGHMWGHEQDTLFGRFSGPWSLVCVVWHFGVLDFMDRVYMYTLRCGLVWS